MKNHKQVLELRRNLPPAVPNFVHGRVLPFVVEYGRSIISQSIIGLAGSCYMQGIEDCWTALEAHRSEHENSTKDYEI